MLRLLDAPVTADEIDHLGHLNVRHYARRAWAAAQAWLARNGLDAAALRERGLAVAPQDLLGHFFREQHEGAHLVVDGAVTEAGGEPRLYVEIVNARSGERAAAFLVTPRLVDRATRTQPAAAPPWSEGPHIALPDHVAPRTLSLDPLRRDVGLAELERRCAGWDFPFARMEGRAQATDCDADGFLDISGAQEIDFVAIDATTRGRLFEGDGHATFGWAMLESRQVLFATPRAGDPVKVLGAEIRIDRKAHWNRRWSFHAGDGRLFGVVDTVSLAFDPVARRSLEIPPQVRSELEAQLMPDLT